MLLVKVAEYYMLEDLPDQFSIVFDCSEVGSAHCMAIFPTFKFDNANGSKTILLRFPRFEKNRHRTQRNIF